MLPFLSCVCKRKDKKVECCAGCKLYCLILQGIWRVVALCKLLSKYVVVAFLRYKPSIATRLLLATRRKLRRKKNKVKQAKKQKVKINAGFTVGVSIVVNKLLVIKLNHLGLYT